MSANVSRNSPVATGLSCSDVRGGWCVQYLGTNPLRMKHSSCLGRCSTQLFSVPMSKLSQAGHSSKACLSVLGLLHLGHSSGPPWSFLRTAPCHAILRSCAGLCGAWHGASGGDDGQSSPAPYLLGNFSGVCRVWGISVHQALPGQSWTGEVLPGTWPQIQ